MADADRMLGMYLHLARASQLRRQPLVRDKMLILAGVQAQQMGLDQISALCRHRILAHNSRHLVRSWPTLTTALADDEFQSYLKQLYRRFSREKIEHMLHSLGIELGRERDAYFNDLEYAAALLDTNPESIAGILAAEPVDTASRDGAGRSSDAETSRPVGPAAPSTTAKVLNFLMLWGPLLAFVLLAVVITLVRALGP